MPNGNNTKDNNTKDNNAQGQKPGPANDGSRRWTPSSRYQPCSDPSSKTSVHSVESNRRLEVARNGYVEQKAKNVTYSSR